MMVLASKVGVTYCTTQEELNSSLWAWRNFLRLWLEGCKPVGTWLTARRPKIISKGSVAASF